MKSYFFIFIVSFLCLSCEKEKLQVIPTETESYVIDFFVEAEKHGRNINLSDYNLEIVFTELDMISGRCISSRKKNKVELDSITWQQLNNDRKRQLIFHELGHCILKREDILDSFSSGEAKSIMCNNTECSINYVSESWKDYYNKELFTFNAELPLWHQTEEPARLEDATENTEVIDTTIFDDALYVENAAFDNEKDFAIRLGYSAWRSYLNSIFLKYGDLEFRFYTQGKVTINRRIGNRQHSFYSYELFDDHLNTTLTIQKSDNFYRFFVNEQQVHIMNYYETDNNIIRSADSEESYHTLRLETFNM